MKLLFPIPPATRVSQPFGVNKQSYAGYGLEGHNGIDWACMTDTPVTSADAGVVIMAQSSGGYGRCVRVQHTHGVTIYGHFHTYAVAQGQMVTAGQLLGYSGGGLEDSGRGNSTGAHLHFEYRPVSGGTPGYGGAIDPWQYLSEEGVSMADPVVNKGKVSAYIGIKTRSAPGVDNPQVGTAPFGTTLEFAEIKSLGKDIWGRIKSPRIEWCAIFYKDVELVKLENPTETTPATKTLEERVKALEVAALLAGWEI